MRKDNQYRRWIRKLPCLACSAPAPSECAHIRLGTFGGATIPPEERGGTGLKPYDRWTVPMCRKCHAEQHNVGERRFWESVRRNPIRTAQWLQDMAKDRKFGELKAKNALAGIRYGWRLGND